MRRHCVLVLAALLALAGAGCGASRVRREMSSPTAVDGQLCHFLGTWSTGHVRTAQAGFPFVEAAGTPVEALLAREQGALRLHTILTAEGFHVEGRLDAERDDVLRVRSMTPLVDGVWLAPGTPVHLADARADRERGASLEIGLGEYSLDDGVHFRTAPTRWVACTELGFASGMRDDDAVRAERAALGLPGDPPERWIAPSTSVDVALVPGGQAFATLGPFESGRVVHVIEQQPGFARVLLHEWTGAMLVGWVSANALQEPEGGMSGAILGDLGAPTPQDVCTTPAPLELFASHEGSSERIGSLDGGAPFVRLATLPDGSVSLRPHSRTGMWLAEGVTWIARPSSPLTCAEETPQMGIVGGLGMAEPRVVDTWLSLTAVVTAATGPSGVTVGAQCRVMVEHSTRSRLNCRATIRCGDATLFGTSSSNGFFDCEMQSGQPPVITGRDGVTTHGSNDAAMTLDTGAGTLIVDDDAESPLGAYHLEAHITQVELVDP